MKPFVLAGFALLVACVALGLAVLDRPAPPAPAVDLAPIAARLDAIEARLAEAETRGAPTDLAPPRAAEAPRVAPSAERELDGRMRELEKRLESFSARETRVGVPVGQVRPSGARDEPRPDLAELQKRARDTGLSELERLAALRELRGQRDANGADARLAVLDEILRLAQGSTDGNVRADTWRQLSHVTDPRLKAPLLDALALDVHAKSREEAAETLADFLPDAGVEAALRHAAENDADDAVRRQARVSRAGGR
ncbi:MAG: hypothetical protein IPJ77_07535 [Planctomycetes bacterium]|nr:hypothetical protein [Planctomycetota bacterium]